MRSRKHGARAPEDPPERTGAWIGWNFALLLGAASLTGATCNSSKRAAPTPDAAPSAAPAETPSSSPSPSQATHTGPEFHIIAFGRTLGSIAPCGCTTEPLGGLPFAFGWMEKLAPSQARLVLEPGSFLFPEPGDPEAPTDEAGWEQAMQRAQVLQRRFGDLGEHLVAGLGPADVSSPLRAGALERYALPRVIANMRGLATKDTQEHRIVQLRSKGVSWKVGVTAVVDPALPSAKRLGKIDPPIEAATAQVRAMREAGAQFTVVLAHGGRNFAEQIAREVPNVDAVVVGVVEGIERERVGSAPARIGSTFILEPGEQLQTVTHLRVQLDAESERVPDDEQWNVVPPKAVLERELARLDERLRTFEAAPDADPAFIRKLRAERERVAARLEGKAAPEREKGTVEALLEQVKVTCQLPSDAEAKQALAAYDLQVSEANRARFAGVKPPEPRKGEAGFVGVEACGDCHSEAVEFWRTTRHANAYETLVVDNKQFDVACVGCHVTGFRRPGGSEVVENAGLIDVQCEVCHGPGSLHVDDAGSDLSLIQLEAPASLCANECHTPEHSDTFDYVPYLRDVLGPGHGEAARAKLGDGPTGRALRAAGLAKAGGSCKKKM